MTSCTTTGLRYGPLKYWLLSITNIHTCRHTYMHTYACMAPRPLTRACLVAKLQAALGQAGLNYSHYSGNSFWIGAEITATQRGLEDSLIQTLGRWRSEAYKACIKLPRAQLASVAGTSQASLTCHMHRILRASYHTLDTFCIFSDSYTGMNFKKRSLGAWGKLVSSFCGRNVSHMPHASPFCKGGVVQGYQCMP